MQRLTLFHIQKYEIILFCMSLVRYNETKNEMRLRMDTIQFIAKQTTHYREKAGLSVADLATKSELTRNYVYQVERGEVNISIKTLEAICNALGIHISQLLPSGKSENKNNSSQNKELLQDIFAELMKVKTERDLRLCLDFLQSLNRH